VVIDTVLSETASIAHYVLPESFYLERDEAVDTKHSGKRAQVSIQRQVVKPLYNTRPGTQIIIELGKHLDGPRGLVAGFGIPLSIGVGIYTGVLLGALTARPFWNNPMLPMLFLISAMMTGSAAICFVGCFIKGFRGMSREEIHTNKFVIHSIDFTLMIFSIIAVFLFILGLYVSPRSSVAAVHLIMGGEFTLLFWSVVVGVGIIIPLAFEVYELIPHYIKHVELREHNPWISGIITTSVLIGGFTMRYIVIYAGQMAQVISS